MPEVGFQCLDEKARKIRENWEKEKKKKTGSENS